ncbi:MAG: tRNA (guanine-N(7)-)-methyltransferase [Candidatus Accumulibacter appositus]|uniref:tRNA (guanine(46)-N(7))-methyltransferase n=1 Tax=Candidatus Accumulibacter appositus TaxID=1454003 RepID=A0A011PXD6_9PROT|nr:methyltransferase domain-containing protein [Accumulibacter sp.]EXI81702.1 MAG: tRNA (guanine-N(7)-)-methyltransferase [Candidatus Accumulibacter appositus]HRF06498.1 SAM-dependent methyltransferase [Accumulibacter sp.]
MQGNSRVPSSAQSDVHEHLATVVARHASAPFRKPYADYNRAAFATSFARYQRLAPGAPLILDAGCGVGESSVALATAYPTHYVIGVDQSAARLQRGQRGEHRRGESHESHDGQHAGPANVDLVRADLVDYWRLLLDAGVRLDRHYLLYPNPWPKIGHLRRRWHGHPVFPALLALGGVLECRSNWPIYIAEHCLAVQQLTGRAAVLEPFVPAQPMTPFERKYLDSGHQLFRTVTDLT